MSAQSHAKAGASSGATATAEITKEPVDAAHVSSVVTTATFNINIDNNMLKEDEYTEELAEARGKEEVIIINRFARKVLERLSTPPRPSVNDDDKKKNKTVSTTTLKKFDDFNIF